MYVKNLKIPERFSILKTLNNSTNNIIGVEAAKEHRIWHVAKLTHLIVHISHVLILFWINNCNKCVFFSIFASIGQKIRNPSQRMVAITHDLLPILYIAYLNSH
jgi:hypothetical protein